MPNKWSSRKFWTMIGSVVLFTGLLINENIPPTTYAHLMTISIGGYFLSNGITKFAK